MTQAYYYGQFYPQIDAIIKNYFPNQTIGNCIEVGGVDGIYMSNTYHYELIGWNSLVIEPIPQYYERLKNNRKNTLNYAISDKNEDDVEFVVCKLKDDNMSAISGLKVDDKLVEMHEQGGWNPQKEIIKVSTRRLDWCIENHFNHETIDFISIDTEGNELDVIKSFDVNKYNIKLLVVENNHNEPFIEDYLKTQGWEKHLRYEVNDFYIKSA